MAPEDVDPRVKADLDQQRTHLSLMPARVTGDGCVIGFTDLRRWLLIDYPIPKTEHANPVMFADGAPTFIALEECRLAVARLMAIAAGARAEEERRRQGDADA